MTDVFFFGGGKSTQSPVTQQVALGLLRTAAAPAPAPAAAAAKKPKGVSFTTYMAVFGAPRIEEIEPPAK